jgi:hypothetical protein
MSRSRNQVLRSGAAAVRLHGLRLCALGLLLRERPAGGSA